MRYHRTFVQYDLWQDVERLRRVVDARTLVAARLEPASYLLAGTAVVDLTFARDAEVAVVPMVMIDAANLTEPDMSPFVWPLSTLAALDVRISEAVEARLLPWILSLSLGRQLSRQSTRLFVDDERVAIYREAERFEFLGAAPYERVAVAMAPYALAALSAAHRRCRAVDAPIGASGVALLSRIASEMSADLGSDPANQFAARWFGLDAFGSAPPAGSFDLSIVRAPASAGDAARRFVIDGNSGHGVILPIVQPVPLDLMIGFDTDDAPECSKVAVAIDEPTLRSPLGGAAAQVVGGSGGRLLFVVREDYARIADSDSDETLALAGALRAEGFTVDIVTASSQVDPAGYDLVHLFSLQAVAQLEIMAVAARRAGVPLVATANLPDVAEQGVWGSRITMAIERMSLDGGLMDERLALISARKISSTGMRLGEEPHEQYHAGLTRVLGLCDGAIVHSAAEGILLRERFGFRGELAELAPFCVTDGPISPAAALVGDQAFVFAHVPIGPAANLLALVRAAQSAKLPLVIAGPVADVTYLGALRRWAGERVAIVTNATSEQIATLYRRASVFADIAWVPGGLARPQRALLSGCRLLLSSASYGCVLWGAVAATADPASTPAIELGLISAWEAAAAPEATASAYAEIVATCDPARTLSATVNLYAQAAARRANP